LANYDDLDNYNTFTSLLTMATVGMVTDQINFVIIARVIYLSSRTINHNQDVSLLSYLREQYLAQRKSQLITETSAAADEKDLPASDMTKLLYATNEEISQRCDTEDGQSSGKSPKTENIEDKHRLAETLSNENNKTAEVTKPRRNKKDVENVLGTDDLHLCEGML